MKLQITGSFIGYFISCLASFLAVVGKLFSFFFSLSCLHLAEGCLGPAQQTERKTLLLRAMGCHPKYSRRFARPWRNTRAGRHLASQYHSPLDSQMPTSITFVLLVRAWACGVRTCQGWVSKFTSTENRLPSVDDFQADPWCTRGAYSLSIQEFV